MDPIHVNEEHLEAKQNSLNEYNKNTIELLGDECKKEFDAVHQAMEILTNAGVRAQLFPILLDNTGQRNCYQFGNAGNFSTFKGGRATKETLVNASKFNHFIVLGFHHWIVNMVYNNRPKPNSPTEYWRDIYQLYTSMVCDGSKWRTEGVIPTNTLIASEELGS